MGSLVYKVLFLYDLPCFALVWFGLFSFQQQQKNPQQSHPPNKKGSLIVILVKVNSFFHEKLLLASRAISCDKHLGHEE